MTTSSTLKLTHHPNSTTTNAPTAPTRNARPTYFTCNTKQPTPTLHVIPTHHLTLQTTLRVCERTQQSLPRHPTTDPHLRSTSTQPLPQHRNARSTPNYPVLTQNKAGHQHYGHSQRMALEALSKRLVDEQADIVEPNRRRTQRNANQSSL